VFENTANPTDLIDLDVPPVEERAKGTGFHTVIADNAEECSRECSEEERCDVWHYIEVSKECIFCDEDDEVAHFAFNEAYNHGYKMPGHKNFVSYILRSSRRRGENWLETGVSHGWKRKLRVYAGFHPLGSLIKHHDPKDYPTRSYDSCIRECHMNTDCHIATWHYEGGNGRHEEGVQWQHKCVMADKKEAEKMGMLDVAYWPHSSRKYSTLAVWVIVAFASALLVIAGLYTTYVGALLVIIMAVCNSLQNHFWTLPHDGERDTRMFYFFQNLSIIGGLLLLISTGSGKYSLDRYGKKHA
jgi:uncharacterized membrane protein YphA (DoxX/SURF4 family)